MGHKPHSPPTKSRFEVDDSTFSSVNTHDFKNHRFGTVCSYIYTLILIISSLALLGVDVYTCLNILVFKRWGADEQTSVIPYEYNVAKWIFTGCIIFQLCLVAFHWIRAIQAMRSDKIARVYLNQLARNVYSLKSYSCYCLFHDIKHNTWFNWACFYSYEQAGNTPQLLLADAPRQVINILTLSVYATKFDGNVIENIKIIATTNIHLSVLLSLVVLSIIIWAYFMFLYVYGIILLPYVCIKCRSSHGKSLKKYCSDELEMEVRELTRSHHRREQDIANRVFVDQKQVFTNPMLHKTTTEFKHVYQFDEKQVSETASAMSSVEELQQMDVTKMYMVSQRQGSRSSLTYAQPHTFHGSSTELNKRKIAPSDTFESGFSQWTMTQQGTTEFNRSIGTSMATPLGTTDFSRSTTTPMATATPGTVPSPENPFAVDEISLSSTPIYEAAMVRDTSMIQPQPRLPSRPVPPPMRESPMRDYYGYEAIEESPVPSPIPFTPPSFSPVLNDPVHRPSLTTEAPPYPAQDYDPDVDYHQPQVPYPVRGVSIFDDSRSYSFKN